MSAEEIVGAAVQHGANEAWHGPTVIVKWCAIADVITADGERTLWRTTSPDLPHWDRDGLLAAAMEEADFEEDSEE